MAIIKSEHMAWDSKKIGNMTQAMVKGEELADVIGIPATTAISANDIVWLKNYPTSTCLTEAWLSRVVPIASKDVSVYLCLLGLDPITGEPFAFKHANEDTYILDNLGCVLADGSSNKHKISAPVTLAKESEPIVDLGAFVSRADKETKAASNEVANADTGKVWKMKRESDTLAMIAEWTMKEQYDKSGATTGKSANKYEPADRNGYMQFGIGLAFTEALTTADLAQLQLQVTLRYKDSMVSETSYGKNYIPVTVSY